MAYSAIIYQKWNQIIIKQIKNKTYSEKQY